MKVYVVYWWDHWDNTECDRRYFLSQERAMNYYEKSKEGDPHVNWIGMKLKRRTNYVDCLSKRHCRDRLGT